MTFVDNISGLFERILSVLSSFGIADLLDICFVAFLIYQTIKIIRETRAFQFAKGLILLALVYFIVKVVDMQASSYIFSKVFSNVILVLIILFQPELRHAIERMGRSWSSTITFLGFHDQKSVDNEIKRKAINQICRACVQMSEEKTGSLIVIENQTKLGNIIETGTVTNADITQNLIRNIFFVNSPLHDGAVVVQNFRLYAAGCVLPITSNDNIPAGLGMRHRAALGVSEQSDAVSVITSEETGIISVCIGGRIERGFNEETLREKLCEMFVSEDDAGNDSGTGKLKKFFEGLRKHEK